MIRLAEVSDAGRVHQCMLAAFEEYRYADVPSSALNETVESIEASLRTGGEKALLDEEDGLAKGSVRFRTDSDSLYFSRLSVCPTFRGRGIAKSFLHWLEQHAQEQGITRIWCRVRMSAPQNIRLYETVGFRVYKEEWVTNPNGFPVQTVIMEKRLRG